MTVEVWPVRAQEKWSELGAHRRQAMMLPGLGDLALWSTLALLGHLHVQWQLGGAWPLETEVQWNFLAFTSLCL